MMDIPHIGFILAAYAVTAVVLLALVAAILIDGREQRRLLARLERRVPARGRSGGDAAP